MSRYVLPLSQVDRTQTTIAGGKGAHLGELSRIDGVRVPPGFCVTTDAYRTIVAGRDEVARRIDRLRASRADAPSTIRAVSQEIRRAIEASVIPTELAAMIEDALATLGSDATYAVRSSATAEDLPTASFAGQHDSYLNVRPAAVLEHVKRCWASLYSDRAVTYRLRNGVDDSIVSMAVVVQRMLFPESAGVIFTADPVTGNRKVAAVEAVVGLGEALVSGVTNADVFRVSDGRIVAREIGMKQLAMRPALEGGVRRDPIDEARQRLPALTDPQVVRLVGLGRAIEAHFGGPQDIEWCMANEEFQIVQSRPITTLFPIPQVDDDENHVYISVGHQQMMTDAMKPLGISVWQLTAARPMFTAGGRLFVDVAKDLASPASRARLLAMSSRSDPLVGDALRTIVERGTFIPTLEEAEAPRSPAAPPPPLEADPSIVDALIARNQSSIAALKHVIANETGPELLDLILADIQELRSILFDRESFRAIMAGMEATWWLDDQLQAWLGEKRAADTLSLAAPNNVTSEMGLALLDVADVIRPRREVIAFLERVRDDDTFLETLPAVPGGIEASDAIRAWLDRYGMRGVGEIDITRPRWIERPSTLVPLLLANVENFEPGAARRLVEHGQREAQRKREELLARLRALPDGEQKAEETTRTIDRLRTFIGYREYPKYGKICREFVYKRALLEEAKRLVDAGVLRERDDLFFLTLPEVADAVRTRRVNEALIRKRREDFRYYESLTPPRVFTSEGEVIAGAYRRDDVPDRALVGLPVSAGVVEGRARVVLEPSRVRLQPGDILVTTFTDPSWTPLFVGISGLVTEVGGLMTHGAVIAREYGLPAVVGVEHATRVIRDGQRIRVHGTDGYVELLS